MPDSFKDAARRHMSDSRHLASIQRFQNAGHLVGFAAECLVKEILEGAGIVIDKDSGVREHFPRLGSAVRTLGDTRIMALLLPVISQATFLQGWKAECRYEAQMGAETAERRFRSWQTDVEALFRHAGIS